MFILIFVYLSLNKCIQKKLFTPFFDTIQFWQITHYYYFFFYITFIFVMHCKISQSSFPWRIKIKRAYRCLRFLLSIRRTLRLVVRWIWTRILSIFEVSDRFRIWFSTCGLYRRLWAEWPKCSDTFHRCTEPPAVHTNIINKRITYKSDKGRSIGQCDQGRH